MTEIIKEIKGFEGRYTISNLGIVRSLLTGKEMKQSITNKGRARVNLRYAHSRKFKSLLVHRLVAGNFIPNPNNLPEVNHKDCNPLNNKVDNLEWCDRRYNIKYSYDYGKKTVKGINNPNAKLTKENVQVIKALLKINKLLPIEIAKMFNVTVGSIAHINKGRTWSDN